MRLLRLRLVTDTRSVAACAGNATGASAAWNSATSASALACVPGACSAAASASASSCDSCVGIDATSVSKPASSSSVSSMPASALVSTPAIVASSSMSKSIGRATAPRGTLVPTAVSLFHLGSLRARVLRLSEGGYGARAVLVVERADALRWAMCGMVGQRRRGVWCRKENECGLLG